MPFWLTLLSVPTVNPIGSSDWTRLAPSTVPPAFTSMFFERSPTIVEVRITASSLGLGELRSSRSTITTSGWKPTEIGRLSTPLPVYVPDRISISGVAGDSCHSTTSKLPSAMSLVTPRSACTVRGLISFTRWYAVAGRLAVPTSDRITPGP